jgi:hypothetical protein
VAGAGPGDGLEVSTVDEVSTDADAAELFDAFWLV